MGATNFGTQNIAIDFYNEATSGIINKRDVDIMPRGIHAGGYLTRVSDISVTLSTLTCLIGDDTYQVRVSTAAAVTLAVAVATPYVILRWAYTGAVSNYMDVLAVASGDIADNDLIVGLCTFTGSTLIGFNYAERTDPIAFDKHFKVEPTSPASMTVVVRSGRASYGNSVLSVATQVSSAFSAPVANSRKDIIYITSTGTVAVLQGSAAASPSDPDCAGKAVIARITLTAGQTTITVSDIDDLRCFVNGYANPLVLTEQSSAPSTAANSGAVYTKDSGTQTELYYREESNGDEVQLTTNGKVKTTLVSADLPSGSVIQHVVTQYATKLAFSAYTAIPNDDTKPTWAEGANVSGLNTAITATSGSTIEIDLDLNWGTATGQGSPLVIAIFKDGASTNECFEAILASHNQNQSIPGGHERKKFIDTAADGNAHTYSIRAGVLAETGEFTVNGWNDTRWGGGSLISSMTITEIKA